VSGSSWHRESSPRRKAALRWRGRDPCMAQGAIPGAFHSQAVGQTGIGLEQQKFLTSLEHRLGKKRSCLKRKPWSTVSKGRRARFRGTSYSCPADFIKTWDESGTGEGFLSCSEVRKRNLLFSQEAPK